MQFPEGLENTPFKIKKSGPLFIIIFKPKSKPLIRDEFSDYYKLYCELAALLIVVGRIFV